MKPNTAVLWNDVPLPDLPQSRRLALLLTDLWQDPSVVALWLGGSLARGDGDAYSDIDLRIAVRSEDFDGDAPPQSARRVTEDAVLSLPRPWDADISQFQLLLPDGELYDLIVQTATRKPAPEARLVLACRDATLAGLLGEEAQDPATVFPPADPEKVRQMLTIFWLGQQKHQKVLLRGLDLIAWKGEHMLRQTLVILWFIEATGMDCGDPNRLTIHTMTPVAHAIEAARGAGAMELLAPPLRTRAEILRETARLRDEVGRVGRALAVGMGFEYPAAVEAVALAGWAKFPAEEERDS